MKLCVQEEFCSLHLSWCQGAFKCDVVERWSKTPFDIQCVLQISLFNIYMAKQTDLVILQHENGCDPHGVDQHETQRIGILQLLQAVFHLNEQQQKVVLLIP